MKLRIKSNSIRYRLTRTDVARLTNEGYLEDKVDFGPVALVFGIKLNDESELISTLDNNAITLFMPKAMIRLLANTDKVGFENNDGPVHLLVEKDFTCLDNVAEDQSDNYPNPLAERML